MTVNKGLHTPPDEDCRAKRRSRRPRRVHCGLLAGSWIIQKTDMFSSFNRVAQTQQDLVRKGMGSGKRRQGKCQFKNMLNGPLGVRTQFNRLLTLRNPRTLQKKNNPTEGYVDIYSLWGERQRGIHYLWATWQTLSSKACRAQWPPTELPALRRGSRLLPAPLSQSDQDYFSARAVVNPGQLTLLGAFSLCYELTWYHGHSRAEGTYIIYITSSDY